MSGNARATFLSGVDTNARRDYETSINGLDLVGTLQLDLGGEWQGERARARADYAAGGRKFIRFGSEDVLVQAAALDLATLVTPSAAVGLLGLGKDRRGADRDYTDLQAWAVVDFFPDPRLDARVRGGAHRFIYRPVFGYSFGAAEGGANAVWRFDKRHSTFVFGDYGDRTYVQNARVRPNEFQSRIDRRVDRVLSAGAGYEYRGGFRLRADYSYLEQSSNSFGESNSRHRVSALFGTRLFWKINFIAQGALQLTSYPDGVFLSPEIILVQDEENSNSLSLKLVRALTTKIDLELRYAIYHYRFNQRAAQPGEPPAEQLEYLRQVAWLGLSVHL